MRSWASCEGTPARSCLADMGREGRTVPECSGVSSFVSPRSRESPVWHRWACSALLGPAPSTFAAGNAGSPDPTFGSGGLVTTAFPGATAAEIASAALQQPDGRLLVGGTVQAPGRTSPTLGALARYNANGSLDSTFGSGGEVLSQPAGAISTLALDAAG